MYEREELLTRILSDRLPQTICDGVYLFAQTLDNQHSVFLSAQELLTKSIVKKILISDAKPKSGFPGALLWRKNLQKTGIDDGSIHEISVEPTQTLNTLIEAKALIEHAKLKKYGSLVIVAAPFHQMRAFMTTITVALVEYSELDLYSYPGYPLEWNKQVAHSQGTVKANRLDLIHSELDRIKKYHAKGDLTSEANVLKYLNKRDAAI